MTEKLRIPDRRVLRSEWIELRREHLLDEVAARPRRGRRLAIALVPAVLILLAATAFTTYRLTRSPTHLESIGCYDRASLDASTTIVSTDGRDPVAICAQLWQQGVVGKPVPDRLAACVLQTGAIGVFPSTGTDTCGSLGLAPLPPSYRAQARRFASLQNAIEARLGTPASGAHQRGPQCVGEADAISFVQNTLASHGYRGWQVKVAGGTFSRSLPCAEPSFDTGAKTVYLLPASRKAGTRSAPGPGSRRPSSCKRAPSACAPRLRTTPSAAAATARPSG